MAACVPAPDGLVGFWQAEGNANDLVGGNNGTLTGGATANVAGVVGAAFSFNGTNGHASIPDSPALRPANLTIEAWVKFDSLTSSQSGGSPAGHQYIVFKKNTRGSNFEGYSLEKTSGNAFIFIVSSASGDLRKVTSSSLIATGVWYHVAGVRGPDFIQLYVNGSLIGQTNVSAPQDYSTQPLYFGSSGQGYDGKLKGKLDEVSLYNRVIFPSEIADIYAAGAAGKCTAPVITAQPQSQTQIVGATVAFTATVGSLNPLSYQWRLNGTNLMDNGHIAGATSNLLTLSGVQVIDAGNYTLFASNTLGSVISSNAVLSILTSIPNDAFTNRIAIPGLANAENGFNIGATTESGEPNHAGVSAGHSVWWKWTAPLDGDFEITTTGSDFDTTLAVYTGTNVGSLNLVAANDDAGSLQSKVLIHANVGMDYQIAVDAYTSGNGGNIKLALSFIPPPLCPATMPDLKLSTSTPFIYDMVVQDDGKIIVSGAFDSISGVLRTNIARLNPNGSVDLTWDPKISGVVTSIALQGGDVYLGGFFNVLDDLPRHGLVRVSSQDGSTDKNWGPKDIAGDVSAIAISGDDVFIGGRWSSVGGISRNNIAKLSTLGSGLVDQIWNPSANGDVNRLAISGDAIFVTGNFTSIGGESRTNLAKLSSNSSGVADPIWNAHLGPANINNGGSLEIIVNGTDLYVSGTFTNVNGTNRSGLAKLSTLGSGLLDENWKPTWDPAEISTVITCAIESTNNTLFALVNDQNRSSGRVIKIDANNTGNIDSDWSAIFDVVSGFSRLRTTRSSLLVASGFHLCNGIVSLSLAKLDLTSGALDRSFSANLLLPGSVNAIAMQPDGKLIVGGDFWFAGGLPRHHLARVNRDGSVDLTWSPNPDKPVQTIAVTSTNVFIGGEFSKVGGVDRQGLAKLAMFGGDNVDQDWDARLNGYVRTLAVSGTNLFVGGSFSSIGGQARLSLAKIDTVGYGDADPLWQNDVLSGAYVGSVLSLALSGTNLYVGGLFTTVNGINRKSIAKVSALGSGALDLIWDANVVSDSFGAQVNAVAVTGTNLFLGGYFTSVGGLSRNGLAKVSTLANGAADPSWNLTETTPFFCFGSSLVVGDGGTSLYAGGGFYIADDFWGLVKISVATGAIDPLYRPNGLNIYALLAIGNDIYVGGNFNQIGGASRYSFAFLPVADAPQLIQDSPTDLFIARNAADGPEVTHFLVVGITNGASYLSDGITPVNVGDFLTVAQGEAGLKFVPGGTIAVVSALNNTPAGVGAAASSLTMSTNPSPVFKFSTATYSVEEGQGSVVIPVRKFGNGPATVSYSTLDRTGAGGLDYQTRTGTFNFSATDKVKNLIIAIADDLETEGDEQFTITLTNASVVASIAGPATAIVTIVDNDIVGLSDSVTTTVSPTAPPASTGILVVSLQPTNAGGQWRLPGELNWHNSSAAISGLVSGNYGIEFRPVNGYREPSATPVTVPISAGTTNQFNFIYAATTNLETGNLSVFIQPDEVAYAASLTLQGQWRRQGGPTNWLNTGELIANLNAGSYTVEFKPVLGRLTPSPQAVQVGGNATYAAVGTYYFGSAAGAQIPMVVPFGTATSNAPYLYNGQIQTRVGFGSGFVAKPRVVLTAAHVLFDDLSLSYVTDARWFFQRYRDQFEPVPQTPRGWYVFEGYASQRQLDNSPGVSTPASQNQDVAAMYFLEDAGRGGYGGYLSSDADDNEYLFSANSKFLVGYPLDGVSESDKGKLHATPPLNLSFTRPYNSVFATTNIVSFPGNSGGPLYVQADVDKYLPAAIYLGGSGQTLVRAINSEVVDLINRAEISGNGGGNSTGGGVILLSPGQTAGPIGTGLLTVNLTPVNATTISPGWRVAGLNDTNYITDPIATAALIGGGSYPIEFKPVPGYIAPADRTVLIAVGGLVTIQASYLPIYPQLGFSRTAGLSLSGDSSATYRVEFATNLTAPVNWTPLTTVKLLNSPVSLTNTQPAPTGQRFYRAVLVP